MPAPSSPRNLKRATAVASGALLALLFLVSGLWKLLDPMAASERMVQSLIPAVLSMPAALAVGIAETVAGVMLILPRYRRWGAILAGAMLVAFMVYIGVFYDRLLGDDCNCFPWIRRVVGPMFFISDAAMLALAVFAGLWAEQTRRLRTPLMVAAGVTVFALASYGVNVAVRSGVRAPEAIAVNGQSHSLAHGRVFLYFFDPECTHCLMVAKQMSRQQWLETEVLTVPTTNPQWAQSFLDDAGWRVPFSTDAAALREVFKFTDPPYGVALVNGEQAAAFNYGQLEKEAYGSLRTLGFIR